MSKGDKCLTAQGHEGDLETERLRDVTRLPSWEGLGVGLLNGVTALRRLRD